MKNSIAGYCLLLLTALAGLSGTARAQGEQLRAGDIIMVGYNFAPAGTLECNGATVSISSYPELFSAIGTTFGGNGSTTFQLPNLNDRVVVGVGQGTGLSNYAMGDVGGSTTVTLTTANLPAHSHTLNVSSGTGTATVATGTYPAANAAGIPQYAASANSTANPAAMSTIGTGGAHNNTMPYLGVKYVIVTTTVTAAAPEAGR